MREAAGELQKRERFVREVLDSLDALASENMRRNERSDLAMVDLRMPRIHGHKLFVDLFKQSDPPIVMGVTGVIEPCIARDLMQRAAHTLHSVFPRNAAPLWQCLLGQNDKIEIFI